jgi:TonB-linked SusC/RagA family outer membrane protein
MHFRGRITSTVLIFLLCYTSLFAQQRTITGTITNKVTGELLVGVNVIIHGTIQGATTDVDGNYSVEVPEGYNLLQYSFMGMRTTQELITGSENIDVLMDEDIFGLDEVVISGIAAESPHKKLPISVDVLNEEDLNESPAFSVSSALGSKVAGLNILSSTGRPYEEPRIQVRGLTNITSYEPPMVIVDGIIMEGSTMDLNIDDIESVEVLKGAASTSMYGSKGGAGVIVIRTKRGSNLEINKTEVTFRTEFGMNVLPSVIPLNNHHEYLLDSNWQQETRFTKYAGVKYSDHPDSIGIPVEGNPQAKTDHYMDNPFGLYHDHQRDLFQGNNYFTNYLSVAGRSSNTNYLASFEHSVNQGIILHKEGMKRSGVRLNFDHRPNDKIQLSVSNLFVRSSSDVEVYGAFINVIFQTPDADLHLPNIDGTPYKPFPVPWGGQIQLNPLYRQYYSDYQDLTNRYLGNYKVIVTPFKFLRLDAHYSLEIIDMAGKRFYPKGKYSTPTYNGGYLRRTSRNLISQSIQATASYFQSFGAFNFKAKVRYLYEDMHRESSDVRGDELAVKNIPTFDAVAGDITASSDITDIRSENIFGILDVDYKGKYIASFLYRYDGSSLFGAEERWHPYHRVSLAYRISEDFSIPGIREFKIRASHGASGIVPPFGAKDESYTISGGSASKDILGNPYLKPAVVEEWEFGGNIDILDRVNIEMVYSRINSKNQITLMPLSSATGYSSQWQNFGTIRSKSFEGTLGINIIQHRIFQWNARITAWLWPVLFQKPR